jgi:HEAT repeat protein
MDSALLLVTVAIAVLAVAVALFVVALASRRLGQRMRATRGREAHTRFHDLVAAVAAGQLTAADAPIPTPPGSLSWTALEEMLRAARADAEPEAARRIERFLDEGGFSDFHLDFLARGDRFERATAAVRLAEHRNPRTVPSLILAVNDPDREVRTAAIRALGFLGAREAVEALAAVLTRTAAGPPGGEVSARVVSGSLVRLLEHPSWRVRGAAAYLLGEVKASECAQALVEHLADHEPDVRAKAAQALGRMEARTALFPLLGRLEDPVWLVRMHAVRALGRLGEPTAAEPVGRRLEDAHWRVRQEAGAALARMGPQAREVLSHTLITASDPFAREQVVEELQRTPMLADAVDHLAAELSETGEPRGPAARLLVAVADTGAFSRLLDALHRHPDAATRRALVHLLGRYDTPRVVEGLQAAAETDADPLVRRDAVQHLKLRAPAAEGG